MKSARQIMKLASLVVLAVMFVMPAPASAEAVVWVHAPWDEFVARYVQSHDDGVNRVDYAGVTDEDRAALGAYLDTLASLDPAKMPAKAQMAYWINFYNALTVQVILQHYPVTSIRQIKNGFFSLGPWKQKRVTVMGEALSLNDIEHVKLRPVFNDPRIHYAVNCASWSCPNLMAEAYSAENIEALLNQGARDYVNHPRGLSVSNGKITASSIYEWYRGDFGRTDENVLAHIRLYANDDTLARIEGITAISYYDYDWTLNEPATE